jgi:hypothetical protein
MLKEVDFDLLEAEYKRRFNKQLKDEVDKAFLIYNEKKAQYEQTTGKTYSTQWEF